jgi:hypothetical protein
MARTIMRDHSFFAADAYDERLTLHARDGVHARYLQEIGDVFSIVYLVKERLLIGSTSIEATNRYLDLSAT